MVCWFFSLSYILIRGDLIDFSFFRLLDPDFIIIIMVYLFAFRSEAGAVFFAFGQGIFIDIFSGGMLGLFALLYPIVFMGITLGSRPLDLLSLTGQVFIVFFAVLIKSLLMVAFLKLFSFEILFSTSYFANIVFSALFSGMIAPFIFYFLNNICDLSKDTDMTIGQ